MTITELVQMPLPPSMSRATGRCPATCRRSCAWAIEVISTAAMPSLHATQPQAALQAERDLGEHVGELLLDELVGGQRGRTGFAIQDIIGGRFIAEFRSTERSPRRYRNGRNRGR